MRKALMILVAVALTPNLAQAENIADCEILVMQEIPDESGKGGAQIATYMPAGDFIASAYTAEDQTMTHAKGHPIRALMCQRNNVIPAAQDYDLLATGVPFILSQNFDSTETDSLTTYWNGATFDFVYKGHPLSDKAESTLRARLADFSAREHGLPIQDMK